MKTLSGIKATTSLTIVKKIVFQDYCMFADSLK